MNFIYRILIAFSNWRIRNKKVKPNELLLLFPHCLQFNECSQNILLDHANCRKCGKCSFAELLELEKRYGIKLLIARGGREAVAAAKDRNIKAVISVACEKELAAGILAILPKKVRAVRNSRPNGPCINTEVDVEKVEKTVRELLGIK